MLQRRSNFTDAPLVDVHDDEIGDIIDEINQTTSTQAGLSVAYSNTVSTVVGDYTGTGATYLDKTATTFINHGLGYMPVIMAYINYTDGMLYALPFQHVDPATGLVDFTADLSPTTNTSSTSVSSIIIRSHTLTPAVSFSVYCLNRPIA